MGDFPIKLMLIIIGAFVTSGGGHALGDATNTSLKQPTSANFSAFSLGFVNMSNEFAKWLNSNWLSAIRGEKEWTNVTVDCNYSNVHVLPFLSFAKNFSCRHPTNASSDDLLTQCFRDAREAYLELKQMPETHGFDRILDAIGNLIRTTNHLYDISVAKEEEQDRNVSSLIDNKVLQVEGQPLGYEEPTKHKNLPMQHSKKMQTGAKTQSEIPAEQLVTLLRSDSSLFPKKIATVKNASSGEKKSIQKTQKTDSKWFTILEWLLIFIPLNCESNDHRFSGNLGSNSTSTKSNRLSNAAQNSLGQKTGRNNSINSTAFKKHEKSVYEPYFKSQLRKTQTSEKGMLSHVLRKAREEQSKERDSNKRGNQAPAVNNNYDIHLQVKHPVKGIAGGRTGVRPEAKRIAEMKPDISLGDTIPENRKSAVRLGYVIARSKISTPGNETSGLKSGQRKLNIKSVDRTAMLRPEEKKRPVVEPGTRRPGLKIDQKQSSVKSKDKTATLSPKAKRPVVEQAIGRPILQTEQKQPSVTSGNMTTLRSKEKKPSIEPINAQPVIKTKQKPGVKEKNITARFRPEVKRPVVKQETGQPILKIEQKHPSVKSGNKTATLKFGKRIPSTEPRNRQLGLKPEQTQAVDKSANITVTLNTGDKSSSIEPGTGRSVLKTKQKQPSVQSVNKTAMLRSREKTHSVEPENPLVLKAERKQPDVKPKNIATLGSEAKRPVVEQITGHPMLKTKYKEPGVKPGNRTAILRPEAKKPVVEQGTGLPALKADQKQPSVKSGNITATLTSGEMTTLIEPRNGQPGPKPKQKQAGVKLGNITATLRPRKKIPFMEPGTGRPVLNTHKKQSVVQPNNKTLTLRPEEKISRVEPGTRRPVFKTQLKEPVVKTGSRTAILRPGINIPSIEPGIGLGLMPEQQFAVKSGDRRANHKPNEKKPLIRPVATKPMSLRPIQKTPSAKPTESSPDSESQPEAAGSLVNYNKPVAHSSIVVLFPSGRIPSSTMTEANNVGKRQHVRKKQSISMRQKNTSNPSYSPRFNRNLVIDSTSTKYNELSKDGRDSFRMKNSNYTPFNSMALRKQLRYVREANFESQLDKLDEFLSRMPNRELRNKREEQSREMAISKRDHELPAAINSDASTSHVKHSAIKTPDKQRFQAEGVADKEVPRNVRVGVRSGTKKYADVKPVRQGDERSGNKTSAPRHGDIGAQGKTHRPVDKIPGLKSGQRQPCVKSGDETDTLIPKMNRRVIESRRGQSVFNPEEKRLDVKSEDGQVELKPGEKIPLNEPGKGRSVLKPQLKSRVKSGERTVTLKPKINIPMIKPKKGPVFKPEQRPDNKSRDRNVKLPPGHMRPLIKTAGKKPIPYQPNNNSPKYRPVGSQTPLAAPSSSVIYTKPEAHSSIMMIFPSGRLLNNTMEVDSYIKNKQNLPKKASISMRQGDIKHTNTHPRARTAIPQTPEPAASVQISNIVVVDPHEAALQMVRTRCRNSVLEGPKAFMRCVQDSGLLDGGGSGAQLRMETKRETNDSGNKSFPLGHSINLSPLTNKDRLRERDVGNMVNALQGKVLEKMTQLATAKLPQSSTTGGGSALSRLPLSTSGENKPQLNMTTVAVQMASLYIELGRHLNNGEKARLVEEECSLAMYKGLQEFVTCAEKALMNEAGGPVERILPQSRYQDQGLEFGTSRAQGKDIYADEQDEAEEDNWPF